MRHWLVIALSIACLVGCKQSYGVKSHAAVGPVNVRCVNDTLSSIPDAGRVAYHHDEVNSVEFLPRHRDVHTDVHVWFYGERGASTVQIVNMNDEWQFTNGLLQIGTPVPASEINRFVPLMRKVNAAIAQRCRLSVSDLQPQRL